MVGNQVAAVFLSPCHIVLEALVEVLVILVVLVEIRHKPLFFGRTFQDKMLLFLIFEVILKVGTADLDLKLVDIAAFRPDELIAFPLENIQSIDIVFPRGKEMVEPPLDRLLRQRFT